MNDMLISRRAEIEAEAKLRGVHSELLAGQLALALVRENLRREAGQAQRIRTGGEVS